VLVLHGAKPSAAERERLESLRRLTAMLGAHLLVEEGGDEIETLRRVARERGTTYVLMGPPRPARFREPLILKILRVLPDIDVRIVADRDRRQAPR
jgi:two-component system sensor histidine kinase KdpD